MREILFRGKAINRDKKHHNTNYKNGDWVYGLITRLYDESFELLPAEMRNQDGVNGIEIDHRTIGQYTGLTDKNGKKIFEGDIVKFIHKGKPKFNDDFPFNFEVGEPYSRNYKIEYINTFASYGLRFINGSIHFPCKQSTLLMYDCKVIGNIHDNPELLEGGAE